MAWGGFFPGDHQIGQDTLQCSANHQAEPLGPRGTRGTPIFKMRPIFKEVSGHDVGG